MTTSQNFSRERREHQVFEELLRSIPGLEERLVQGSEDEVDVVAELVSIWSVAVIHSLLISVVSLPKARPRQEAMIQKALKVPFSTGSPQRDKACYPLSHVILR